MKFSNQFPRIMAPTLLLRDDPGDSAWDAASNQTISYQPDTSSDLSAGGFIAPLAVFICILCILLISCV